MRRFSSFTVRSHNFSRAGFAGEHGASLIELAVILPLAMTLIAGLVDVGFKISTAKTIALAARHSARIAASQSRDLSQSPLCGPAVADICSGSAIAQPITSLSVTEVARDAACNFLRSSKMDPSDWRVIVAEPFSVAEGGRTFDMITVTVQRATSECWICVDQMFASLRSESSSSFVLEGGMLELNGHETGATMVEFALASVILLLIFGVFFDVGLGIHRYAIVKQVTSDVTRMIAEDLQTHRNCSQVKSYFEEYATPQLQQKMELNVNPTWRMSWDSSGTGKMFDVMRVRADFRVKCFFLCSFARGGGWPVTTSSEIVIERSRIGPGGTGCPAVVFPEVS